MKKLIGIVICMLLIAATVLPVAGMVTNRISETNNPGETACENGNYNLVQQLNPTRRLSPRVYLSGTIATLDAYVINEGPDDSSEYTLELKWTRILGLDSGVLLDVEVGEYGPLRAGYGRHVYINLECYGSSPISVLKAQVTNSADDLNPDDNTDSFIYIVIG